MKVPPRRRRYTDSMSESFIYSLYTVSGGAMTEKELKGIFFMELKRVAPEYDPTEVNPDENIFEELDIDSHSFQRLLFGLSDSTGVDFSDVDYERSFTLSGIMRHLSACAC